MSGRPALPMLDSCELEDEAPIAGGTVAIDTAEKRLQAWSTVCVLSAANLVRVDDVLYSWDCQPRRLKNGALEGRVYAQRRGEPPHDIGGYKVGADGVVLKIPPALAGVLPGCGHAAATETNGDRHG